MRPGVSIELEGIDGEIVVQLPEVCVASDTELRDKLQSIGLAVDRSSSLSIAAAAAALRAGEDPMVPVPEIGKHVKFDAGYNGAGAGANDEKYNAMRSKVFGPRLPLHGFMTLLPDEEGALSKNEKEVAVPIVALDTLAAAGALRGPALEARHAAVVESIVDDLEFAREAQDRRTHSIDGFLVLGVSDEHDEAPEEFYLPSQRTREERD